MGKRMPKASSTGRNSPSQQEFAPDASADSPTHPATANPVVAAKVNDEEVAAEGESWGAEWDEAWDEESADENGYDPDADDELDALLDFDWEDDLEPVPDEDDFWMPEEEG